MKLVFLILIWLLMGLFLVTGVVMAVHGSFWMLAVGLVGFVLAVARIGCLSH
jgi:hypothetical protein